MTVLELDLAGGHSALNASRTLRGVRCNRFASLPYSAIYMWMLAAQRSLPPASPRWNLLLRPQRSDFEC
jgi:hypothetical protein